MTKLLWIVLSALFLTSCSAYQDKELLENDLFKISLDQKGRLTEFLDKKSGENLLIPGKETSLLTAQCNGKDYPIKSWKTNGDLLTLNFEGLEAELTAQVIRKPNYLSLEIISVESKELIEKVVLGPYHILPSEKIGQSIGLAYDDNTAVGLMGLNLKSRGGFEIVKRERYGNASQKIEGGASLTAFVRDRSTYRTVDNWEQKLGQAVPLEDSDTDQKIIGAKFALFCVPSDKLLEVIETIEQQENLPHIKSGGTWNKKSKYSTSSKFIMSFNVNNIDKCIDIASKAGITCIYHGGIFKNWGTFQVRENDFPNGYQSVRECADKAEKQGISLGAHCLTNFITTNDPMVSPTPHPDLVLAGVTQLKSGISATDTNLFLEDEKVHPAYYEPDLKNVNPRWRKHTAVRIGDEIIEYTLATADGQLVLQDCKRGAFGTTAVDHKQGEQVARLMSHGYKVFFPNISLQDQMAKNLANFFNVANLKRISFDGIEGGLAAGHGRYGSDRFVKVFYDNLKAPNIVANSSDVTHFGWHYFSNESWGEPWESKNFREPHLEHRIQVQKALKEDLLPRKMGQFSINESTTKDDIEWVMGLCAGFDAGVDFYVNPNFEEKNKAAGAILSSIKKWENARMNGLFTEEQKEKLRAPYTLYGLEETEEGVSLVFIESWAPKEVKADGNNEVNKLAASIFKNIEELNLSQDYKHANMTTEPGQPTAAIWQYNCEGPKQNLQYLIQLTKTAKEPVKGIYLKVGSQKAIMPFTLQPGEYILNKGNKVLQHYTENHEVKDRIAFPEGTFLVSSGKNMIEFDYKGKEREAGPELIINFATKKK